MKRSLPTSPAERVDWAQVRLLLGVNWRLRINLASRTPVATALGILLFLMFGAFAVIGSSVVAIGIAHVAAGPDRAVAAAGVHLVFFSVAALIVVTPVLGFRGSEFLDVTKLFAFPIGHRTAFAATLLGLMTSGSVMFFSLPVLGAALGFSIGSGASAPEVVGALLAAVLLLVTAVALGQFILLAFLNTLRSRKWRDLSMVLVPLVFGGGYVAFSVLSRTAGERMGGSSITATARWFAGWMDFTLPLPSWWAGHAVTGTGPARFLPALALLALTAWLVRASAVLQERAFLGDEVSSGETAAVERGGVLARVAARLSGPLGALVEKELSILRREPAVRSILIGQMMYPVAWGGFGLYRLLTSHTATELAAFVPFAGLCAYPLLLMELGLVMNLLGLEGGGAVHSLLLPVRARLLLFGKDVAYLLVFGTLNALTAIVLTLVAAYFTHSLTFANCVVWPLLGALEGYCVLALGLGIGNVMSVISPIRVAVRDRRAIRQQVGGREGCLRGLIGLVSMFGTLLLAAVVAAAFHLPAALERIPRVGHVPAWLVFVTIPVGVVLAAAALLGGAAIGGRVLEARTEDVAARLGKSDD